MTSRDGEPGVLDMYPRGGGMATLRVRSRRGYGMDFATIMLPGAYQLARRKRPAAYYQVLLACLIRLDPIHWRQCSASVLAQDTGLSVMSVTRALKLLEADRVVLGRGRSSAKARRLSREVASKSTSDEWRDEQDEAEDMPLIDARGR